MANRILDLIAEAIKEADKSWLNEDYSKQALNVSKKLREAGLEIVPLNPPEELISYAIENMPFGRMQPEEYIESLYKLLVKNARKYTKTLGSESDAGIEPLKTGT